MRLSTMTLCVTCCVLLGMTMAGCPSTAGISISPDPASVAVGTTLALSASSGDAQDALFSWSSGDETIATVDAEGVVTGVNEGYVEITATGEHSGQSASVWVTVYSEGGGEGEGEGARDDVIFIHHSVGQNWLDHSLNTALLAKTYIDERNDITYGTEMSPDAGRPESLGSVPGDSTDMNNWLQWFNDYLGEMKTFGCSNGANRIVLFKSCFPNSHIEGAGTEPGDPFGDRTLANYRAVYRHPDGSGHTYEREGYAYHPLEDIFAANPDTLFIPVTAPPECWAETDTTTARRARTFNNWLINEWLPSYVSATGLHNVAVFNLFDVLAYPDSQPSHANELRAEYGGNTGDSHPNDAGNAQLTLVFATGSGNFLDQAWNAFMP